MASLDETPQWEDGIYQLETSDPVMGGPNGISNTQSRQLANRTLYLKKDLEAVRLLTKYAAPSGAFMYFAGRAAPEGWLKANGASVSRDVYADLFAAIGTTFGVGDGVSTFQLPDLRGEFLRGFDDGASVDSGRVFGSKQTDSLRSHSHNYTMLMMKPNNTAQLYSYVDWNMGDGSGPNYLAYNNIAQSVALRIHPTGDSETRPRNVSLLACIKF